MSQLHNPYVGLRPFFLRDSLHFFGREAQTAELLAVLRQHRFLGVVGSSGSGKSSLVRAGLLPALFGGFLVGERDRWRIVQIKPGDSPIRNLAAGLLAAWSDAAPAEADIAALEAAIRDEQADAVVAFAKERLTDRESLFLLVDQFEEIFAFRRTGDEPRAEASDVVALLMALAEEPVDVPVFVALTMRTDFLGDCDLFYGLPEIMNRGQYLVPRLTRQQLRLAIEGPAMLTGAIVAPQLMDLMLNQLGDREDRLPVIQHALLRTWDAWHASGATGPIEVRHFEEAGGLENALNLDAEAALAEVKAALPALDDRVIARVFKALTDTDLSHRAVRRPARVNDLMAASGADRATVDTIIRCFSHRNRNFLYADGWPESTDPRVDISHESLIRQWTRLRDWVADEREMRDQFLALVARARSWQKYGVVLQGNELKSAEAWWKSAEPSAAWARRYAVADDDFAVARQHLTSSTKARRRTKVTWAVSAAIVTVAIVGALSYVQRSAAKRAADTELLRDMENQATLLLERDPESAIVAGLIAAQAHHRLYPKLPLPVTLEATLLRAWQDSALVEIQPLEFTGDADYAVLEGGTRAVLLGGAMAVNGKEGIRIYDLNANKLLNAAPTPARPDGCLALSSDRAWLNFSSDGLSGQWVINSGTDARVQQFQDPIEFGRMWVACEYSPDGTKIALISHARQDPDWSLTLAGVSEGRITKIRDIPLAKNATAATALRFSQSGNSVIAALAISETETAINIFNVGTGAPIRQVTTSNAVSDLALSQQGLLVTVEKAYTYALFFRDIQGEAIAAMLPNSGSDDDYGGLAFSSDGQFLAAANGNTARLWEVATGFDIAALRGHSRAILAIGFDAIGRLVTVGKDADVRVWQAGNRQERSLGPIEHLHSVALSSTGEFAITASSHGETRRWMVARSNAPPAGPFNLPAVFRLALSPDGRLLAFLTSAGKIGLLDSRSGEQLTGGEGGSPLGHLAFSPDGRRLALTDRDRVRTWTLPSPSTRPYQVSESVVISGKAEWDLEFEGVSFDPAGRQVATLNDGTVYLWDATTGACEGRIEAQSPVFSMAYVPGGGQLATGDVLGRVRFWSLARARMAGCDGDGDKQERIAPDSTLQEHRGPVRAITFVADGSRFATASDDRTAKVWDTKSGRVVLTIRQARAVTDAAFSSDGRLLMTNVDNLGAKVWEIPHREEILAFARTRVKRECLTKEERQRFFPDMPVDDPPCVAVGR